MDRHRQTVVRWIKDKGLIAERTKAPWLIRGSDLKDFLGVRRAKVRTRLAPHHLYCLGCKTPQEPAGKFAEYTQQSPTTGMLQARSEPPGFPEAPNQGKIGAMEKDNRANRYSPETRARTVQIVLNNQCNYESQASAIKTIASKFGCGRDRLRRCV